jgi:hypothetical protein
METMAEKITAWHDVMPTRAVHGMRQVGKADFA